MKAICESWNAEAGKVTWVAFSEVTRGGPSIQLDHSIGRWICDLVVLSTRSNPASRDVYSDGIWQDGLDPTEIAVAAAPVVNRLQKHSSWIKRLCRDRLPPSQINPGPDRTFQEMESQRKPGHARIWPKTSYPPFASQRLMTCAPLGMYLRTPLECFTEIGTANRPCPSVSSAQAIFPLPHKWLLTFGSVTDILSKTLMSENGERK